MGIEDINRLKIRINEILREELPGNTTLEQAETIACGMLQVVETAMRDRGK